MNKQTNDGVYKLRVNYCKNQWDGWMGGWTDGT